MDIHVAVISFILLSAPMVYTHIMTSAEYLLESMSDIAITSLVGIYAAIAAIHAVFVNECVRTRRWLTPLGTHTHEERYYTPLLQLFMLFMSTNAYAHVDG